MSEQQLIVKDIGTYFHKGKRSCFIEFEDGTTVKLAVGDPLPDFTKRDQPRTK